MKRRLTIAFALCAYILFCGAGYAQWTTFAPMPTARWGVGCASEGGKLYVISGNGVTNNEVYTPGLNTWATLAPIPIPTAYPQMASYAGKIYVLGGTNGGAWLTNHQIYTIATNTWSTGAALPSGRMGGTAVAYNGKIYMATGWNGVLMSSLDIYDIATNTWSSGAAAPTARYQTRGGLINGRMYIAGGYTSTWVGTNEVYDIATNTWSVAATMPVARYIHAAGSDGALLHLVAGYTGAASNSYQSYDPAMNAWTTRANAPTARYRVDGAVVNGCMYVAGGFNGSVTVPTLEGFCGLVVLPDADRTLFAARQGQDVALHWTPPATQTITQLSLERSLDGNEFVAIASMGPSSTAFTDIRPTAQWLAYRLAWYDQDGQVHYTNVESVEMVDGPRMDFHYSPDQSKLTFIPDIPFPLDQGTVALLDMNGRILRQEQVRGQVDWDLSGLPSGAYVFQWIAGATMHHRKFMR